MTDTLFNGCSFSPTTRPDTHATFFCAITLPDIQTAKNTSKKGTIFTRVKFLLRSKLIENVGTGNWEKAMGNGQWAMGARDIRAALIGRRQTADGRRQTADGRRQTADGRRQTADGRRQTADGRRQTGPSLRSGPLMGTTLNVQ
ncbi:MULTISPECIES: hypothetical protein [Niastella]|uniref:Uncharacterized protein n=1 Tax=Niastella soli TaxID=2821487 RepID=A0ABS3Z4J1_9BACT|nr:hypothetical protein [Niastella soli]MBO9205088.1 hypothetical protein [Niastella soli]